ncbi:MAG: 6-phosphogluconolactonase [Rhodothermales bacterium]
MILARARVPLNTSIMNGEGTVSMRKLLLALLFANFAMAAEHVYVSAGSAVTVFRVAADGTLGKVQRVELPGAGPQGLPPDQRHMYVTAKTGKKPAIATFKLLANAQLELLRTDVVNLRPGYLRTDSRGRYMAGNHYSQGKISIWRLHDGRFEGETIQELDLEKKAHSTVFSPDDDWLLVPATGPNRVFVNRVDPASGKAAPGPIAFSPGPQGDDEARQPRHLIFHPTKPLVYTSNERESPGVCVWKWHSGDGVLTPQQNIVTQPDGYEGQITTADLHLTPDARFLYVSNRDTAKPRPAQDHDSIVGFRVDGSTGNLTMIGHTACERVPRSFVVAPSGRFLYVAGQGDGKLGAYQIDRSSGALTRVAQYDVGHGANGVSCLAQP